MVEKKREAVYNLLMANKTIQTVGAPEAIGPYAQAVKAGNLLFLSGQIPLIPGEMVLVEGGIKEQTKQVLENLRHVLEAGGAGYENVVKTTVYLSDMAHFADMNQVYAEYFGEAKPARATVQVAGLPKGALVEIDAIAAI